MPTTSVRNIEQPFADVFKALDAKVQRKAMRGAIRREGNRLKKAAVASLNSKDLGKGTRRAVSGGIYLRVFPDNCGLGFMVSVKPHGRKKGAHLNRAGLLKPVLMWAEDGTDYRRIGRRVSSFFGKSRFTKKNVRRYLRGGAGRGRMKPYHFLADTEKQDAGTVEKNLFDNLQKNVEKQARKAGLL